MPFYQIGYNVYNEMINRQIQALEQLVLPLYNNNSSQNNNTSLFSLRRAVPIKSPLNFSFPSPLSILLIPFSFFSFTYI